MTLRTCTHAIVTSQTIAYPNPNPNQKNIKFGARNPNPFRKVVDRPKGRAVEGLTKRVRVSRFVSAPNLIDEWTGWYARDVSKHAKCDTKCTESKINSFLVASLTSFDKHYAKMIALANEWFCFLIKMLQRLIYLSSTYFLNNNFYRR